MQELEHSRSELTKEWADAWIRVEQKQTLYNGAFDLGLANPVNAQVIELTESLREFSKYANIKLVLPFNEANSSINWLVASKIPIETLKGLGIRGDVVVIDTKSQDIEEESKIETRFWSGRRIIGYVYKLGNIRLFNLDHHVATPEMKQKISAAHLALRKQLYKGYGEWDSNAQLIVGHTDADSILSVMLLKNLISPKHYQEVAKAVVEADHTGRKNDLADLLQATTVANDLKLSIMLVEMYFDYKDRGGQDFDEFLKLLPVEDPATGEKIMQLHDGEEEMSVEEAVKKYRDKREAIESKFNELFVGKNLNEELGEVEVNGTMYRVKYKEGVLWIDGERGVEFLDNEFLGLAVPPKYSDQVKVVVFSRQMPDNSGKFEIKARVTEKWLGKIDLKSRTFGLLKDLFGFGCRHNTGSTFRSGGSNEGGAKFIGILSEKLEQIAKLSHFEL